MQCPSTQSTKIPAKKKRTSREMHNEEADDCVDAEQLLSQFREHCAYFGPSQIEMDDLVAKRQKDVESYKDWLQPKLKSWATSLVRVQRPDKPDSVRLPTDVVMQMLCLNNLHIRTPDDIEAAIQKALQWYRYGAEEAMGDDY